MKADKRTWGYLAALAVAVWIGQQVRISLLIRQVRAKPPSVSESPDPMGRLWIAKERAAIALGACRARRAVPALTELLKEGDWGVRASAAYALGRIGDPSSVEPLIEVLKDPNSSSFTCRRVAAAALWRITGRYIGMSPEAWQDGDKREGGQPS